MKTTYNPIGVNTDGETTYNGYTLEALEDQLLEMQQMQADLAARKITPTKVIGRGYGPNSRRIANEYIDESIRLHRHGIALIKQTPELCPICATPNEVCTCWLCADCSTTNTRQKTNCRTCGGSIHANPEDENH